LKKILKIISTTFFIGVALLAAVIIFYFFQSKGDIGKAPSLLGYKPLTILSNSMKPTFSAGDAILINVDKEPKVGSVITYKHPDGVLVTHRVVRTFKKDGFNYFETKGDNNKQVDDIIIPRENIVGVQEKVIPKAGYVAKFVSGPIGFSLLILIPLLAYIIIEIFQRLGIITEKKEEIHG
jgi:signal peptidase I